MRDEALARVVGLGYLAMMTPSPFLIRALIREDHGSLVWVIIFGK